MPKTVAERKILSLLDSDCEAKDLIKIVAGAYENETDFNTKPFSKNDYENEKTPLMPIDGFPKEIQDFITNSTEVYQTPRDYFTGGVLYCIGLAIGDKMELETKYKNIPILWMSIVGGVGIGKTNALKMCLDYFQQKDTAANKEYKVRKKEFDIYDKLSKEDKAATSTLEFPIYTQYILQDYTPEALNKVHEINPRGICVYRDELKGFFDDMGRYSNSGEQSVWLSSFTSEPIKINRAADSSDPIHIEKPCIFLAGGIQPDLLGELAKDNRQENGFISRMLFVYPEKSFKPPYSKKTHNKSFYNYYNKVLHTLATIEETRLLTLSVEVEEVYERFYNENVAHSNSTNNSHLKGVFSKMDIIVLRFAIIFHGVDFACNSNSNSEISEKSMQSAVKMAEYFLYSGKKVSNHFTKKEKKRSEISKTDMIIKLSKNKKITQYNPKNEMYIFLKRNVQNYTLTIYGSGPW